MFCYYTLDGSNPEGAGGAGSGTTRAVEMNYSHPEGGADWWMSASLPQPPAGTRLKYKIGIFKEGSSAWFPGNGAAVARIGGMLTRFDITGFDATAVEYFPHNDYARVQDPSKPYGEWAWATETGLQEGFHVLRARAFLRRGGNLDPAQDGTPIYNTYTRTFYYDAARPAGEIVFPAENDTLGQQSYGVVVRSDRTVTGVWFQIADGEAGNDDAATGVLNGNGAGFEPFADANANGSRDPGESFEDLNGNGVWDDDLAESWVRARPVQAAPGIASAHPLEWRFDYRNIPASGSAQIRVRLKEASSSPDNSLGDAAGHFTTLTRTVNTAGPDTRLFVAFPQADGEVVGEPYVLKAYFTKNLGQDVSDARLAEEFTVKIGSSVSGSLDGAVTQDRAAHAIVRDETADFHALALPLPNLFNGDPEFQHLVEVSHQRGGVTLRATRALRAAVSERPFLAITAPPAVGSDGRRYELVLPALAAPGPADRATVVRVETDARAGAVTVTPELGGGTITPLGVVESGSKKIWEFRWDGLAAGAYRIRADAAAGPGGPVAASVWRDVRVVLRQLVAENPSDDDDDDDGIADTDELGRRDLPAGNSESWTNGDVHAWRIFGRTNPLSPDSDDDLLPDGLESGIGGVYSGGTNAATDTDGDGFPNFTADADPPVFNTTDNSGHPRFNLNRPRTDQLGGSMTDPAKPDSDDDGLRDGREDLNRNGRVEVALLDANGAATAVLASPPTLYNTSRVDRGALASNARLLETDPNNPDSDGDGLADGAEDANGNGRPDLLLVAAPGATPVDFDLSAPANAAFLVGSNLPGVESRALDRAALDAAFPPGGYPRLLWLETDPLDPDSDGDGLPDGWEITNGLDPLDNGTVNLRDGGPGDPRQGAAGDPDGDGFSNLQELQNGTKPLVFDGGEPPPASSIVIGPGTPVTSGGTVNDNAFTDWSADDLVAFDEFQGEGPNNQGGDVFRAWDGFDSSRDIVAFYARDGGADGHFYFRLDFQDLRPQAEEGHLDIYVVIDTGNPASGEAALPDDVDILTAMKWEAVVACYQSDSGRVYIDTNPAVNSSSVNEPLAGANGVVAATRTRPMVSAAPISTTNSTPRSFRSAARPCSTPAGTACRSSTTRSSPPATAPTTPARAAPAPATSAGATTSATRSPTTGWPRTIGAPSPISPPTGVWATGSGPAATASIPTSGGRRN
jgi:hypothetical protein